jgi:hypothetical protein
MQVIEDNLAAPQGFEPRYADPESAVLPLNEGAACRWTAELSAVSILWAAVWAVNRSPPISLDCAHPRRLGLFITNPTVYS